MNPQTMQAVFDCLLGKQTDLCCVEFARQIGTQMLGTTQAPAALASVFTRMNGYHPGWFLRGELLDGTLRMPVSNKDGAGKRDEMMSRMNEALDAAGKAEADLEVLLDTLERYGSTLAAAQDISEYDYRKMVAAIAACASVHSGELSREQELFLLYTADFSGIQKFIYTVSTANALKALRSRSFFLELAMEHYMDELLSACGMSRVNILHSGGGHCYILLPNTQEVVDAVTAWNTRFNHWLGAHFGINLYLAHGYTLCCANDLTNTPAWDAPYKAMFRRVSHAVSRKKMSRYTPEEIRALNQPSQNSGERECQICGTQSRLTVDMEGRSVCSWCSAFETLSSKIFKSDLIVAHWDGEGDFVLPGYGADLKFSFCQKEEIARKGKWGEICRVYGKNCIVPELPHCIRLLVGDYATQQKMSQLARASEGVSKLGVCRMDVDNLGQSFVSGFEQDSDLAQERQKYVTLMRTSAFSRQMSLFFQCYINQILSGRFGQKPPLEVAIVYAGGDDVFLVGAWTDVIEAARRIRDAFQNYTCGALTLSAGIGMFQETYPIRLAANETAELEDEAKNMPGKDSVSVFTVGQQNVFKWSVFEKKILREKMELLKTFFAHEENTRGTAFLYVIRNLLDEADQFEGKGIPLARLAYMLARMSPPAASPAREMFEEFSRKMYQWALDPEDRRQLVAAIRLFMYQSRKA